MRNVSNLVLEGGGAGAFPAGATVISRQFARARAKLRALVVREVPEGFEDSTGFHYALHASPETGHSSQPIGFEYLEYYMPSQEETTQHLFAPRLSEAALGHGQGA
jgi:hypothetical protein